MMSNPVFSIITCTFNAAATLERTIRSVDTQTYPCIEHLIIDGASKDGTLEIAATSKRARVISEPDKGLYDAMNKGIRMATGDYIIFLNAGDKFHTDDTLEKVSAMIKDAPDIIYGETVLVDNDGKFKRMRRLQAPNNLSWKSFKKGMLVCHQSFWAKRELALRTPYDLTYRYSADVDWCIRIMKQSKVFFNTHETLIDYLEEGMSTKNRKASLKERFKIMNAHYGLFSTLINHIYFLFRAILYP